MKRFIKIGIPVLGAVLLILGVFSVTAAVSADNTPPQGTYYCPNFANNSGYGYMRGPTAGMMGNWYGTYGGGTMMGSGYGSYQGMMGTVPAR